MQISNTLRFSGASIPKRPTSRLPESNPATPLTFSGQLPGGRRKGGLGKVIIPMMMAPFVFVGGFLALAGGSDRPECATQQEIYVNKTKESPDNLVFCRPLGTISGTWNGYGGSQLQVNSVNDGFLVDGTWGGYPSNNVSVEPTPDGYHVYGTWNGYPSNDLQITRNGGGYDIKGTWNGYPQTSLSLRPAGNGKYELSGTWNGYPTSNLTFTTRGSSTHVEGRWNGYPQTKVDITPDGMSGRWNGYPKSEARVPGQTFNGQMDQPLDRALTLLLMDGYDDDDD